uniref:beta-glucosidase n=1 Tax=Chrysotila carterae TaxID=13221 RepID=A0A7S4B6U9_CHRCT
MTALEQSAKLDTAFSNPMPMPYKGDYPQQYIHAGQSFPKGFVWGVGTAAYQIEGGARLDGRGPSIWDTFSGGGDSEPDEHMQTKDNGDVACDHYHRMREDVKLMKDLGLRHYRFSISWSRILPNGTLAGGINEKGVNFYHDLINTLHEHDIEPYVTLYHWDLPQALQTRLLPGWLDKAVISHFVEYASLCFRLFSDRVSTWMTFNEPWTFIVLGYGTGSKAPGGEFAEMARNPYTAGHNVLLAHGEAVRVFRNKRYKGRIGVTNNMDWREPLTPKPSDIAAAERSSEWWLGWFCDPIWLGDYPASMRKKLGRRLPTFSEAEKEMLRGSADFFGLNHYGSGFATDSPTPLDYDTPGGTRPSYWDDFEAKTVHTAEMPRAASAWLYSVPWGLRKLLNWISRRYSSPVIYVTENGWSTRGDESREVGVVDPGRVLFYANYTSEMQRAINEDGVDVRGYFAWSLMDNFEWEMGYSERFGLVFTDYATQQRYPKLSARWYTEVMRTNSVVDPQPFIASVGGHAAGPFGSTADEGAFKSRAVSSVFLSLAICAGVVALVLTLRASLRRRQGWAVSNDENFGEQQMNTVPPTEEEERVKRLVDAEIDAQRARAH